jgi:Double zinc ribbon
MKCARCQHENRLGAKFCEECAAPLARACANCGAQLSATAKFCSECAHPAGQAVSSTSQRFGGPEVHIPKHLAEKILTSKAALEGERKQVTVLFADLKGSMELLAERDPEEARKILDPVLERMMEAVHRYESTVNQVMGDGIIGFSARLPAIAILRNGSQRKATTISQWRWPTSSRWAPSSPTATWASPSSTGALQQHLPR